MRQRALLGLAAVALLTLAACGGDDDDARPPTTAASLGDHRADRRHGAGSTSGAATSAAASRRRGRRRPAVPRRPLRGQQGGRHDHATCRGSTSPPRPRSSTSCIAEQPATTTTSASTSSCSPSFSTSNYPIIAGGEARDRVRRLVQRGRRLRHGQRRRARRRRRRGAHRHRQPDREARRGGDARGRRRARRSASRARSRPASPPCSPAPGSSRAPTTRPCCSTASTRSPTTTSTASSASPATRATSRASSSGPASTYDLFDPTEVRRPRLVRDPVHHQGVGRRPPDGGRGLPAGDDEGARRRPRRPGRRDARRPSTSSRPTATRASCRWRARRSAGRPTPSVAADRDAGRHRHRRPRRRRRCRPSSTPTPRSACSAAPPPTPATFVDADPIDRVYDGAEVIWPVLTHPSAEGHRSVGARRLASRTRMTASARMGRRRNWRAGAGIIVRRDRTPAGGLGRDDRSRRPLRHVRDRRARRSRRGCSTAPRRRCGRSGTRRRCSATATYVVYEDERYTYAEIGAQVRSLAHHLRDVARRRPGDRVALAMRNYPEWVVGYWAITSIGAAVVGMNAWWTTPEMEYGLARLAAEGADRRRRAHRARAAGPRRPARRAARCALIAVRTDRELPADGARWADVVVGRRRTGRRCPRPTSTPTTTPRSSTRRARPGSRRAPSSPTAARSTTSTTWCSGPWSTAAAEAKAIAAGEVSGAGRSPPGPRDRRLHGADAAVPRHRLQLPAAPVHAHRRHDRAHVQVEPGPGPRADRAGGRHQLLRRPDDEPRAASTTPTGHTRDHSSLRGMGGGGAPLQPDLVEKIDKSLADGAPVHRLRPHRDPRHRHRQQRRASSSLKPASCGPIMPTLDAKLVDDDGNDLPAGPSTVGQLCVRGLGRHQGLPQPARGDGRVDPRRLVQHRRHRPHRRGRLRVHRRPGQGHGAARRRERLLLGGRGGDLRARRRRRGRRVRRPRRAPRRGGRRRHRAARRLRRSTPTSCATFLDGRIAKHKIPATIWFRDSQLPRNANGKFLKRELRAELVGS